MILRLIPFLTALALCCTSLPAFAQYGPHWEKIRQIPKDPDGTIRYATCGFFWSKNDGVIGTSRRVRTHEGDGGQIFYIQNGVLGKASHVLFSEDFEQLVMKNRDTGYAAVDVDSRVVLAPYMTVDGGRSWTTATRGTSTDVFITKSGRAISQLLSVTETDFGWARTAMKVYNRPYHLERSFDDAQTWERVDYAIVPDTTLDQMDGIAWSPKYKTLVMVAYGYDRDNGPLVSTDSGKTFAYNDNWGGLYSKQRAITGDIRAGRHAMYVQTNAYFVGDGLLRSTDGGYTWKNVGGPGNLWETRFRIIGCTGATVIAFDTLGGIWYSETGGDGTMPREVHSQPLFTNPGSISASLCSDSSIIIPFLNDLCDDFRIDSIWWAVTDPVIDPQLYASGALTLSHPQFPHTYSSGQYDSLQVHWDPKQYFNKDTVITRGLRVRYYSGTTGRMHDTTLNVTLTAKGNAPRFALSNSTINFPATSTCFSADTTITITNTGCDTLSISNMIGSGASYTFGSVSSTRLAPGESASIDIAFHPQGQGLQAGNLQLTSVQQGITRKIEIPITGTGTQGEGKLELMSASSITLPMFTICANGSDTTGSIRNNGCDSIIVKSITINGANDYTLTTPQSNVTVAPDSSLTFGVAFSPASKGTRNSTITIVWTNERGQNEQTITITLDATVTDGTKVLASSLNTINFGETNICEERDSTVRLTNTGCDTLTITNADIDKNFELVDVEYPIVLAPNESADLPIITTVDTAGKPTLLSGTLTVTSTADNTVAPISLSRQLYYPTRLRIEAVDEASGRVGDEVTFRITLEGNVPPTMSALHFDLLHNNDLLSFEQLDGTGLSITNTIGNADQRQSFTLSPVQSGILGEMTFRTYLAEADQTALTFENIRFDAAGLTVAPECIAAISDSGSRFTYIYTCSDPIVQEYLRNSALPFRVVSMKPNPVKDQLSVEIESMSDVTISVIDVLGNTVLQQNGRGSIHLDTRKLSSGLYLLRIEGNGGIVSRSIVKE